MDLLQLTNVERGMLAHCCVDYAKMLIGQGIPYRWGGDNPMTGFDCSGFVVECLQSVGLLAAGEDLTADGLYKRFKDDMVILPKRGSLVLFAKNGKMNHVGLYWKQGLYFTAEGGGSKTGTLEDAVKDNAYLKLRPCSGRKDPVYLDVFKLRDQK